ncbi:NAD(P)H-hydrate dehydratase [Polynucleobacter sp. AP-Kolm-20A-A1]|uniref:NAD(P)H-hydrate dehydratase n=1 Tax=Polynucleobacter sp. AP-Kolm-20A-A1 TaxID=2081041 RepID=UPI001BFE3E5C|nr:NAD(P)H-hydrate dehydratase [Polynucleobacter sp. AP-Kolm-20A-A1]QWE21197.1 NAD(P)H-hydrate dehydratase [Polynucleobacter sp. AP-Kolm-20A-A1]
MAFPNQLNALPLAVRLKREPAEHKGSAGKVMLIGGAPGMAGALVLAGNACLHLGAGWTMLEMLDPASAHADIDHPELMIRLADQPNAVFNNDKPDVIAIGPGLGKSALAIAWLQSMLAYPNIPLVIDADALNLISESEDLLPALKKRNQEFPQMTVLTPHPGEAAKLLESTTEQIQSNREGAIEKLVNLTGSIVVLKGQHTLIASLNHPTVVCTEGNPGMGTGGMGDILTGSLAAIAAQGIRHHLNLWQATGLAVQLHASAADSLVSKGVGPIGLTPSETIFEMRSLLNKLL